MQGLFHARAVTRDDAWPHLMCDFDILQPLKEILTEVSPKLEIGRGKDAFGSGSFLIHDDAQPGVGYVEEFAPLVTVG